MASLGSHVRFMNRRIAWRMLKNQLRVSLLGQWRMRNAQLALTYRCNHACRMCSSNRLYRPGEEEMSLSDWEGVADQLYDLGCTHYDLTGGEPTCRGLNFLTNLTWYINRHRDCLVSLATNGKLVTPLWLETLRTAGLNSVLFDIQPGDHDDWVKDPGNLAHIRELIPQARDLGLNVCINTCLGNYNLPEFEEMVQWAEENDLHVLTNLAAPTGELTGQDVRMTEFKKAYYGLLGKYPRMRSDATYNYFGWNRCPGGREKLYITAYGDVMQCTFVQVSYGNLRREPLKTIYRRFRQNPWIRKRHICKHTFWQPFREIWLNPIEDYPSPPIPLEKHPSMGGGRAVV